MTKVSLLLTVATLVAAVPNIQASTETDFAELTLPQMVNISGGSFTMGCKVGRDVDTACPDDQLPAHTEKVDSFHLSATEVTFKQWDLCVQEGGCSGSPDDNGWGRDNRPVIDISWIDAHQYTAWLSEKTGQSYRLPTEAEWEYAARAGGNSAYSWGARASHDQANYGQDVCCNGHISGKDQWEYTAPVASFPPNGFGLYDMHGNAKEWVQNCWSENHTPEAATIEGSMESCTWRVVKGGAWIDPPKRIQSAARRGLTQDLSTWHYGFRVARDG